MQSLIQSLIDGREGQGLGTETRRRGGDERGKGSRLGYSYSLTFASRRPFRLSTFRVTISGGERRVRLIYNQISLFCR